jgi:hypothetical protein
LPPVDPSALDLAPLVLLLSPTEVRVSLPQAMPAGEYRLILAFEYRPGAGAGAGVGVAAGEGAAPRPGSTAVRTGSGSVEFTVEPVAVDDAGAPGSGAESASEANVTPEETR